MSEITQVVGSASGDPGFYLSLPKAGATGAAFPMWSVPTMATPVISAVNIPVPPLPEDVQKPVKPPKLGNFHFTPRKKQQVVKSVGSYKYLAAAVFGQKSCKILRRPGSWFTTHRCATHDVLIIWKLKDGIPWT